MRSGTRSAPGVTILGVPCPRRRELCSRVRSGPRLRRARPPPASAEASQLPVASPHPSCSMAPSAGL